MHPIAVENRQQAPAEPRVSAGHNARQLWNARAHRLRTIDTQLASLPAAWLDSDDEQERQRLHAWITVQQGFLADLNEAVRLRGQMAHPTHALAREEQLLLQEVDRFIEHTERSLATGRAAHPD